MGAMFPFEIPQAAGGYLVLYGLTLLIHAVFMNYVLAGCGYMAIVGLCSRNGDGFRSPLMMVLRDWMPFALSAAITAGVAPLLFVQILYKKEFYTANLLLGPRVMMVLPALIVAFYLLYVIKSRHMAAYSWWLRAAMPGLVFVCFAYTGWTWTENHLLAIHERDWVDQYVGGAWAFRADLVLPRFLMWCFGSVPTLCVLLVFQFRQASHGENDTVKAPYRSWGGIAIGCIVLATACALWAYYTLETHVQADLKKTATLPYLWIGVGGLILQIAGWWLARIGQSLGLQFRWLLAIGLLATMTATIALREVVRLAHLGTSALDTVPALASGAEGLWAFLLFFVFNAVLIGWCVYVARNASRTPIERIE